MNLLSYFLSSVTEADLSLSWRDALGTAPPMGETQAEMRQWLAFHKRKWAFQKKQRQASAAHNNNDPAKRQRVGDDRRPAGLVRTSVQGGLGAFIQKKTWALLDQPWQIIQMAPILHDGEPSGLFKLWVMVREEKTEETWDNACRTCTDT